MLNSEFKKSRSKEMNRIIMMIAGMVGVAGGMGFVMPAIALYRNQSVMSGGHLALLIFGIALTLGGARAAASGYVTRRHMP